MTTRLLADENIPLALVEALRRRGHDVAWVVALMPGADDGAVLRRATAEGRTCLTLDKGLGELASRAPAGAPHGVILLRLSVRGPAAVEGIAELIHARTDWPGHVSVIEPGRLRMRPLGLGPT